MPPEPFRMAGKHITEKLSKVSMEEMCCPAIDSNRIAALHTETDDRLVLTITQVCLTVVDYCSLITLTVVVFAC